MKKINEKELPAALVAVFISDIVYFIAGGVHNEKSYRYPCSVVFDDLQCGGRLSAGIPIQCQRFKMAAGKGLCH